MHEYGSTAKRERIVKVKKALKEFESVVVNGGTWKGMVFMPHYGEDNVEVVVVSHGGFLCQLMGYPSKFHSYSAGLKWYESIKEIC